MCVYTSVKLKEYWILDVRQIILKNERQGMWKWLLSLLNQICIVEPGDKVM